MAKIVTLYRSGKSLRQIAEMFGVSPDTIRERLSSLGMTIRSSREALSLPAARDTLREKAKGRRAWNRGLTKDNDPRVKSYATKLTGRKFSEETRSKISASRKKKPWYVQCQECGREKGKSPRPRCCSCAARYRAKKYPNPMKGRKLSAEHRLKLLAGTKRKPTSPERFVSRLLEFMFRPYTVWRYTGDGKFFIRLRNGKVKNPDFVCAGQKKVIEVFGRYWHRGEEVNQLVEAYRAVGWECLVIWDDEMKFGIRDQIMEFTYPEEFWAEREESLPVSA